MNKNYEQLINNLIPVLWHPGHMGAFFGRFLFDDIYVREYHDLLSPNIKANYTEDDNFEWSWGDRIGNYFSYNDYDNSSLNTTVNLLKKYYSGTDLDSAMMYITAQHYNDIYKNDIIKRMIHNNWKGTSNYNEDQLLHMVNKDFDFDFIKFEFPYIKSHVDPNIYRINKFNWKQKVLCTFPLEKNWIALFLVFYKHSWFHIQRSQLDSDHFDKGEESTKIVTNQEEFIKKITHEIPYSYRAEFQKYPIDDYIIVDIYDLIFNKNTKNLEKIDSCFEKPLSNTRLDLLETAKNHIENICNMFGLDPEMNMPSHTTNLLTPKVREVLKYLRSNRA